MIYKKLNKFELTIAIITSIAILLFYIFFNFNYLSNWIDEKRDASTYDYYVRLGIPEFLFNPHHIGFDWLGEKLFDTAQKNGYEGSAMVILQLRNLLISAIGLSILFFLFFKISKKYLLSLLLIMMIGFSCAFWIYSQINDTPIIHSILLALLFFASIYFPQAKNKYLYALFLGSFHAIVIFFHQTNLIFFIVISFIILLANNFINKDQDNSTDAPIKLANNFEIKIQKISNFKIHNLRYFFIYLISFTFIVVIGYYYVGIVLIGLTLDPSQAQSFNQIKDSTYFFNWLILYSKIDHWGKGYESNILTNTVKGISTYFFQPQMIDGELLKVDIKNVFALHSILPNLLLLFFTGVLLSGVFFSRLLYKKFNYVYISTLLFVIIYTVFACWWEPDYREFWVAPMFSFWILSFLVLYMILDKFHYIKPLSNFIVYSYLFLLAFLLFYFNFTGFLYPNASYKFRKFEIIRKEAENRSQMPAYISIKDY